MEEERRNALLERFRHSVEAVGFNLQSIETIFDLCTRGDIRQLKCDYSIPFGKHRLDCLLDFKAETISHIPFFKGYLARLNINPGDHNEAFIQAEEFYFKVTETIQDCNVTEAYNLLCGRSILKFESPAYDSYVGNWVALTYNQGAKEPVLTQYPNFNLKKLLDTLPVKELDLDHTAIPFINSLLYGNITPATLIKGKDSLKGFVSIDAAKDTAVFYNDSKERIPFEELWLKKNSKPKAAYRMPKPALKHLPPIDNKGIRKRRKR